MQYINRCCGWKSLIEQRNKLQPTAKNHREGGVRYSEIDRIALIMTASPIRILRGIPNSKVDKQVVFFFCCCTDSARFPFSFDAEDVGHLLVGAADIDHQQRCHGNAGDGDEPVSRRWQCSQRNTPRSLLDSQSLAVDHQFVADCAAGRPGDHHRRRLLQNDGHSARRPSAAA